MGQYVSLDGDIIRRENVILSETNRAFKYGDGLFETMRIERGKLLWPDLHFVRLQRGAERLRIRWDTQLTRENFVQYVEALSQKNHGRSAAARVRFALFRNAYGLYTPKAHTASFLMESDSLPESAYPWHAAGLTIGVYPDQQKMADAYSSLKTSSALIYVMAALYKQEHGFDDCLILNHNNFIAECIASNIFLIKDNQLVTPSLDQACVDGVMRRLLIQLLAGNGIHVQEGSVSIEMLQEADEIICTNAIQGIYWVRHFGRKEFGCKMARYLSEMLTRAAAATV